MCVSRHFEKYNAVITVVTPCKYVSPQMWSPSICSGEMKQAEVLGKEESEGRGSDRHLTFQRWKVREQQKMEIADFLIIGVWDRRTVVLLWLSEPACSHLFRELHLCNFLLGPCFLITSIISVCVYVWVSVYVHTAVLQFHNVSICFSDWE